MICYRFVPGKTILPRRRQSLASARDTAVLPLNQIFFSSSNTCSRSGMERMAPFLVVTM